MDAQWTPRALLPCSEPVPGNTPAPQGLLWDEKLSKRVTKEAQALAGRSVAGVPSGYTRTGVSSQSGHTQESTNDCTNE